MLLSSVQIYLHLKFCAKLCFFLNYSAAGSQETAETAATQCFVAAELSQTSENAPTQCYTETQLLAADVATPVSWNKT